MLLFSRLALLLSFWFLILSTRFFVVFFEVWYSMSDIDVIFVIPIPPSLTGRDKSWCSSSLHVLPSNGDVVSSCRMIFSMGCSRWLMLSMVRILSKTWLWMSNMLLEDKIWQFLLVALIWLPVCLLSWSNIPSWTPPYQLLLQGAFYLHYLYLNLYI